MAEKQAEEQRMNPATAPDPDEDDLSDLDGIDYLASPRPTKLTLLRRAR